MCGVVVIEVPSYAKISIALRSGKDGVGNEGKVVHITPQNRRGTHAAGITGPGGVREAARGAAFGREGLVGWGRTRAGCQEETGEKRAKNCSQRRTKQRRSRSTQQLSVEQDAPIMSTLYTSCLSTRESNDRNISFRNRTTSRVGVCEHISVKPTTSAEGKGRGSAVCKQET